MWKSLFQARESVFQGEYAHFKTREGFTAVNTHPWNGNLGPLVVFFSLFFHSVICQMECLYVPGSTYSVRNIQWYSNWPRSCLVEHISRGQTAISYFSLSPRDHACEKGWASNIMAKGHKRCWLDLTPKEGLAVSQVKSRGKGIQETGTV